MPRSVRTTMPFPKAQGNSCTIRSERHRDMPKSRELAAAWGAPGGRIFSNQIKPDFERDRYCALRNT